MADKDKEERVMVFDVEALEHLKNLTKRVEKLEAIVNAWTDEEIDDEEETGPAAKKEGEAGIGRSGAAGFDFFD